MRKLQERTIIIRYCNLKEDKKMGDGSIITSNILLRKISGFSGGMFMVDTIEDTNIKRIFWVKKDEIIFTRKEKEKWTSEQFTQLEKEKRGLWL